MLFSIYNWLDSFTFLRTEPADHKHTANTIYSLIFNKYYKACRIKDIVQLLFYFGNAQEDIYTLGKWIGMNKDAILYFFFTYEKVSIAEFQSFHAFHELFFLWRC